MSKSGVNTGFAKCFILFMAIIILLQGCLYFGLSIWGITQENCSGASMDAKENPFRFVLDLIYFIRQKCGNASLTNVPGSSSDIELDINWTQSFMITDRMYIFLIVYAVISGLWIVGSLLVIATVCGPVTKLISAFCFWPWFMFVIAGSILDAVATGYYIDDIVHTTTAVNTFEYVGIKQPDSNVMDFLQNFDAYFITPSVVLACVSSRVILIWLLNIFGASFCLSLSRVLSKQQNHKHHHKHHHTHELQHSNEVIQAPYTNHNQSQSTNQQNRAGPLIINATNQQSPKQTQMMRQSSAPYTQSQPPQSPHSPNASALTPDVVVLENIRSQNVNRETSSSSNIITDDITYRKTDNHPDRLDYPIKTSPTSPKPITSTAQLSTGSILNTRYSSGDGGYNPLHNQSPQRVSDELRSQLPWSYTSMITKPSPTRKTQSQLYPGIPGIPEPDYDEESNRRQQNQQSSTTGVVNDVDQQNAYSRW